MIGAAVAQAAGRSDVQALIGRHLRVRVAPGAIWGVRSAEGLVLGEVDGGPVLLTSTQRIVQVPEESIEAAEVVGSPYAIPDPLVCNYVDKRHEDAIAAMTAEAQILRRIGYESVSQVWIPGRYSAAVWILAIFLMFLFIGLIVVIVLLLSPPAGTLSVTYRRRMP
jgi:hypothetical protein